MTYNHQNSHNTSKQSSHIITLSIFHISHYIISILLIHHHHNFHHSPPSRMYHFLFSQAHPYLYTAKNSNTVSRGIQRRSKLSETLAIGWGWTYFLSLKILIHVIIKEIITRNPKGSDKSTDNGSVQHWLHAIEDDGEKHAGTAGTDVTSGSC